MKNYIIKFLVNIRIKRISKVYGNKINQIKNSSINVDSNLISLHKEKWAKLTQNQINIKWLNAYVNNTKIESPDFVPESIYYTLIEPIVNSRDLYLAYADKNIYDLIYLKDIFPTTVVRNINDTFLDKVYSPLIFNDDNDFEKMIKKYAALIIKPAIESGGGDNVYLFRRSGGGMIDNDGNILNLSFLKLNLKKNYIIQKVLSQHSDLQKFNMTSVNTIRVLTWLSPVTGEVEILHSIFRVGAQGQYVDNSRSGGYAIGVKPNGTLNDFATNKLGEQLESVNGINLLKEHKIPFFKEIKMQAKNVSSKYLHFRLLGLDMTVDESGMVHCIEINNKGNEINFYQLNNGPLFGNFTDEIIDYCIKNKSKIYESYVI